MKPVQAWAIVALAAALAATALLAPWPVVVIVWAVALTTMRSGRTGMLAFTAVSIVINGLLLAWLQPGHETLAWGLGVDGARAGIIGALRVSALVAGNLALLQRTSMAAFLEGLHLPRRATGFLAALLIASRDVGADFQRLREARLLAGDWPARRLGQVRAASQMLPSLLLASWRRSTVRREALRGAGIEVGPRFAPIVAVAALAIAGRLALVVLPNVALTYVIVFVGGIAFGPRVGWWAGIWSMALTDLLLTGLAPAVYVNAPAMGLIGLLGGWLRRIRFTGTGADGAAGRVLAGVVGVFGTFLFSVTTDVATWALVPEFRTSTTLLWLRVAAGLAFNVVPAATNAVLFALAVGPVQRAFSAAQRHERHEQPQDHDEH